MTSITLAMSPVELSWAVLLLPLIAAVVMMLNRKPLAGLLVALVVGTVFAIGYFTLSPGVRYVQVERHDARSSGHPTLGVVPPAPYVSPIPMPPPAPGDLEKLDAADALDRAAEQLEAVVSHAVTARTSAALEHAAAQTHAALAKAASKMAVATGHDPLAEMAMAGPEWTSTPFDADIYPSRSAAMNSLVLRLSPRIRQLYKEWEKGLAFYCHIGNGISGADADELSEQLAAILREQFPKSTVYTRTGPQETPLEPSISPVHLALDVLNPRQAQVKWSGRPVSSGTLRVKIGGIDPSAGEPVAVSVRFEDKPWVENTASFLNGSSRRWIVGRSLGPVPTQDEADRQAREMVSDALSQEVLDRLRHRLGMGLGLNEQWLRQRIASEVSHPTFLADRFAQSFPRPYGTIWRKAVLVDASSGRLDSLADTLARELRNRNRHYGVTGLSILGLSLAITVIYLFANTATKGYFTWRLRLATILLVLIGALLVAFMA